MGDPNAVRHVVTEVPTGTCMRCEQTKPAYALVRVGERSLCKECLAWEEGRKRAASLKRLIPLGVVAALTLTAVLIAAPWFASRRTYELSPHYSMEQLGTGVTIGNQLIVKRFHDSDAVLRDLQTALDAFAPTSDADTQKLSDWYRAYLLNFGEGRGRIVSQTTTAAVMSYRVRSKVASECEVVLGVERRTDKIGVAWRVVGMRNAPDVVRVVLGREPSPPQPEVPVIVIPAP